MVSSRKKKVEVVKKLSDAEWLSHTYTEKDDRVAIGECEVLMSDIYRKVEFV